MKQSKSNRKKTFFSLTPRLSARYPVSMNFPDFLKELKKRLGAKNIADLYRILGGETALNISLRHFQSVDSGARKPPEGLFINLFKRIKPSDKKAIVLSYIKSHLGTEEGSEIIEYLDKYLSPEVASVSDSAWSSAPISFMTDEQLDFLINNSDCFLLHKRALMLEKIPIASIRIKQDKIAKMANLGLIKKDRKYIRPSITLSKIPNVETHGSRSVSLGTVYTLRNIELFLAKEGHKDQTLSYAFQMVTEENAKRIHQQINSTIKWIQSMAAKADDKQKMIPLVFVSFTKSLNWKEME